MLPLLLAFASLVLSSGGSSAFAAPAVAAAATSTASEASPRDGRHDFDFNLGVWKTRIKRYSHPLSARADEYTELSGTVTVRGLWGGRALLEEIAAEGPNGPWNGLTLFLYDPKTGQWTQSFAGKASGTLGSTLTGSLRDGRLELISQDTVDGKLILVRGVWSEITPTAHRYREEYSGDGGRSWAPAFDAQLTRADAASAPAREVRAPTDARQGSREFDFDIGTWRTHSSRLLRPLTGSNEWADLDGMTVVRTVWGGAGNVAEYKADGPAGQVELMALRLYNPRARQWSINFATPSGGTLGVPAVGEFRNGRGDFYDREEIAGRTVLVRFSIWPITADTAQSEQAFSADGGKTWEVNWINRYARVADDATQKEGTADGDSRHDFDFELGEWDTHVKRLQRPLSGSTAWLEYRGSTSVRGVLGGRANLAELAIAGPAGHIEGASLRLYRPQDRLWSLNYFSVGDGELTAPVVGKFTAGRGEFLGEDTLQGRPIAVRFVISKVDENTYRFEQAFSGDGGKTWESNWIATDIRRRVSPPH